MRAVASSILVGVCIFFLAFAAGCRHDPAKEKTRQLNLYIWSAYVSPEILKEFEKQTGIHVNYDTYDSNQVLLEKLRSGVSEYDVIVPTNWLITSLIHLKLIESLDPSLLPNKKNLMQQFQNPAYDSNNQYSIPFVWGTNGIAYDSSKIGQSVDSWSILWDAKYRNRISMLDNAGDCFLAALKWKGHSLNSRDPQQLSEARDLLVQQKPLVKVYNSSNFDEILLSGDVWIAYGYSGQLARAMDQNPDIRFVVPKEGSLVWMDTLAIPTSAPHKKEAYEFLNFCLSPRIAADITNNTGYSSANQAAQSFIQPKLFQNPARYPDPQTLARCEWSIDQPDIDKIKDRYWTEIKLQ
ncbi:MAG TPA: spermidine/putrescine ABC transporter substrate-binding protein [Acidobacteriota bacterium]